MGFFLVNGVGMDSTKYVGGLHHHVVMAEFALKNEIVRQRKIYLIGHGDTHLPLALDTLLNTLRRALLSRALLFHLHNIGVSILILLP
jgi:hypothetical protein